MIPHSELILNSDASIYHLNLLPEDIASKIILVGDPDRVDSVSKIFDSVRVKKQKREFVTHTGSYQGKEITVISTGIGTDNIDIVLNELDALVNIDLKKREVKTNLTSLDIVRVGTSGSIQAEIDIDTFLVSEFGLGMDGMMNAYDYDNRSDEQEINLDFSDYLFDEEIDLCLPYCFGAHTDLLKKFSELKKGITLTHNGFYAPQGRQLRAERAYPDYIDAMVKFKTKYGQITNFEMETAGIYGLSSVLGHKAISLSLILANRSKGQFSEKYKEKMDDLIQLAVDRI
ncbi:MAG: nucleoside phosphorylase [Chitinophagales bacterium]|jgi:uridine phosphorylase|nr:nucleoside phosphorylase [Sphingobacteriales bacterium]